ncbi:MAG: hypothetical protein ABJN72_05285 [Sulfitobacter sp.]
MDAAGILEEIRTTAEVFELTKWELYFLIVVVLVILRLPAILTHRREMAAIRADFEVKSAKLSAKLDALKEKKERRAQKGGNK